MRYFEVISGFYPSPQSSLLWGEEAELGCLSQGEMRWRLESFFQRERGQSLTPVA
jgi:hypothetical protein